VKLVVDWDGTATEFDGLYEVIRTFGDERIYEETEDRLGELTLNDVIAIEVATVTAPLPEVVEWVVENVRLRAGFAELARSRDPLVVSSGFHELIEPVLERERLELDVRANRLESAGGRWRALFRNADPCTACGESCKRSDVAGIEQEFAYVGDGVSDRCVALAASRVFARDGLADYLTAREVPFEPFEDFYDVARALAGAAVVPPTRRRGRKT
jgi:2-hydroxy-3-keto-5-methylthiopentenyl-1-phosphate phosphatase